MSELVIDVPKVFADLEPHHRYIGAYGGRGGAKSHYFAQKLIIRCYSQHTRAVCIREVQESIKESVKQLLEDKIIALGLDKHFTVLDNEIRGRNGSLIIFKGMKSYNAANIKSLEAYNVAWVEEAQTLSEASLKLLRPTIRKRGSELWFSWNPRYRTDPVDVFFRKKTHPDAVSLMVNWSDNPWFKETDLYVDMLNDYETDEDDAEHVWGGQYGANKGAVLGKWLIKALKEKRLTGEVRFDPQGHGIEISSDIGFHDTATWWFWQRQVGGFKVLGAIGDSGLDADDWVLEIADKLTEWGLNSNMIHKIHLPHDAKAKTFQSKHSSVERFITAYGPDKINVVPISRKTDQISAARLVMNSCEFDKERCEIGLEHLEAWKFDYIEDINDYSREPLHDFASHWGDGFAYGAQMMRGLAPKPQEPVIRWTEIAEPGQPPHANQVRLNDLWKTQAKASRRI